MAITSSGNLSDAFCIDPLMRILLAEDDPMIGAAVERGLRQEGFVVDWVRDGVQAHAALATQLHDALLLDLGLPR